jgi:hypothetical protein
MHKPAREHTKTTLADLIADRIVSDPVERGGMQWAAFRQEPLAAALGVAVKTVERWTKEPPFQREIANVDGETRTLLRVLGDGEAPTKTPQYVANIMRKVWAEKVGTKLDARQHGCLIALAEEWPESHQVAIFTTILNDWPGFMAATKHAMEVAADKLGVDLADVTGDDGEPYALRFFNFPTIPYMRRFHMIGPVVHAMALQDAGKHVPAKVNAIYQAMEGF